MKQLFFKKMRQALQIKVNSAIKLKITPQKRIFAEIPNKMRKKTKTTLLAVAILMVAAAAYFAATTGRGYYMVKMHKIALDETAYIYITPQDNAASVAKKIKEGAPNASMESFHLLAKHNNFDSRKRSGKYAIKDGDTMSGIYNRIVSRQQTPVRITIPSTRNVQQAIGHISRQLMMDSASLAQYTHPVSLSCFGHNSTTLPSFLIPDTYEVYWDITPEHLFAKFAQWNRSYWNEQRLAKAKAADLTPLEVATLASIVDEETANTAEMPTIAGLYINRLKRNMPLQADPTVKYALGDPSRKRILKKDLEVESPYNTYRNNGLPPGPIRIPSKQALESVLNYKKHDYLYMCAKEDFSGTHNFAKTLSEHNANAQRYQKELNKLNIKR